MEGSTVFGSILGFFSYISVYGASQTVVGSWLTSIGNRLDVLFSEDSLSTIANMMVSIGCITLVVGGALLVMIYIILREDKKEWTKWVMLAIVIIAAFGLLNGILAFAFKSDVEASLRSGMNQTIAVSYGRLPIATRVVDRIQVDFRCCGANNYSDYTTSQFMKTENQALPLSCCKISTACIYGQPGEPIYPDTVWTEGCVDASLDDIMSYYNIAGGLSLVVIVLQLLPVAVTGLIWIDHETINEWQEWIEDKLPFDADDLKEQLRRSFFIPPDSTSPKEQEDTKQDSPEHSTQNTGTLDLDRLSTSGSCEDQSQA